ncbi:RICIN domain-containing protein [Streptomyces fuscigenes]|uniref:RICIN domain-containing protein n=1 Tax=Streptomyces fuscigenes TaxID=1528880 RepID=UPI001F3F320F|nr:RICIN domain-containing protein [Streptomyces fuscigenes]MCF3960257.1 ricin-type beta-trefoil lectin domain protein [Streptomyces fuscigenes]
MTSAGPPAKAEPTTGRITGPGDVHTCVDVTATGRSAAKGTAVILSHCDDSPGQQWTMAGDHTIRSLGKCIDIVGSSFGENSKLQLWSCDGRYGEQWVPVDDGALRNPSAGLCIDDPAAETNSGTRLQLWECNHLYTQSWTTPRVPDTNTPIRGARPS